MSLQSSNGRRLSRLVYRAIQAHKTTVSTTPERLLVPWKNLAAVKNYTNESALTSKPLLLVEADVPRGQRIDGVVSPYANILARMKLCPSLTYNYLACFDELIREFFEAQALTRRAAMIADRTSSAFCSRSNSTEE